MKERFVFYSNLKEALESESNPGHYLDSLNRIIIPSFVTLGGNVVEVHKTGNAFVVAVFNSQVHIGN